MLQPLKLQSTPRVQRGLPSSVEPLSVKHSAGTGVALVSFSSGQTEQASCIRCPDAPCLHYSFEELQLSTITSFPADGDLSVCPTGALNWALDATGGPTVKPTLCIGCGLCAARCPVGAIGLDSNGYACVSDHDTALLTPVDNLMALETRKRFNSTKHSGALSVANNASLERLHSRLAEATSSANARFPNLLSRNLLLSLGWSAVMRRAGDQNVRMDILALRQNIHCVTEVEFSNAVIDAPRSVLDGVAVMRSRYSVPTDQITGLIICLDLPNQRSEFYRVVQDITNVLGLHVHTLTPSAMIVLVWSLAGLSSLPYVDAENTSLRAAIEATLGHAVPVSHGVAGALEAPK